jgi:hypothetical protein
MVALEVSEFVVVYILEYSGHMDVRSIGPSTHPM